MKTSNQYLLMTWIALITAVLTKLAVGETFWFWFDVFSFSIYFTGALVIMAHEKKMREKQDNHEDDPHYW